MPPSRGRRGAQPGARPGNSRSATAISLAVLSALLFAAGFVFIGFFVWSASAGPHLRYLSAGFLTACASFAIGALVGLIVGIPRFVSSGAMRQDIEARRQRAAAVQPAARAGHGGRTDKGDDDDDAPASHAPPSSQLTPSTNLAEISDWLTKLLLGAGLVELTRLGHPLSALVNAVARSMQNVAPDGKLAEGSTVIGSGILALYVVLGFLDSYIITTLWYGKYLERFD
jgi:hypothetical protein